MDTLPFVKENRSTYFRPNDWLTATGWLLVNIQLSSVIGNVSHKFF